MVQQLISSRDFDAFVSNLLEDFGPDLPDFRAVSGGQQ
jgi:hypothetical protein